VISSEVVGARGQEALLDELAPHLSLDEALAEGVLSRRKIAGRWVYAESAEVIARASDALAVQAEEVLRDWLIVPLRILAGAARKRVLAPAIGVDAAEALLKGLAQGGSFLEVGMLTLEAAPYLALASRQDADELERQIAHIRERMLEGEVIDTSDLLPSLRERDMSAWRGNLLRHAEFLGLGSCDGSALVPWAVL
jgi:hypothetical protein